MRGTLCLGLSLVFFLACGIYVEQSPRFDALRDASRGHAVSSSMLRYGSLGDALRNLGLITTVKDPYAADKVLADSARGEVARENFFRKKRKPSPYLHKASLGGVRELPSSHALSAVDINQPVPVISIVADEDDLRNPESGALAHTGKKGRETERLAYATCYVDGEISWASAVGIRGHGSSPHREHPSGIRLYFRDLYGISELPIEIEAGAEGEPLVTAILRRKPYVNGLAFDIARQIGAKAPTCRTVMLHLNGRNLGPYGLTEHLSPRQMEKRFGHDDFYLTKSKGRSSRGSMNAARKFMALQLGKMKKVTMSRLGRYVDIDNLTRHVFSIMYCGTTDWRQGVMVRDRRKKPSQWYWINWDMDHSFVDLGGRPDAQGRLREPWEQEALQLMLVDRKWWLGGSRKVARSARANMFRALLRDDPDYQDYYVAMCIDALNHRITKEYLDESIDEYLELATQIGAPEKHITRLQGYKEFFAHREGFILEELQSHFGLGALHDVHIAAPEDFHYVVDGYDKHGAYHGAYFEEGEVSIAVADDERRRFSHWEINGERSDEQELTLAAHQPMRVHAVLRDAP